MGLRRGSAVLGPAVLQVGALDVEEARHRDVGQGHDDHEGREEQVVRRTAHVRQRLAGADDPVHRGGEQVAQRDCDAEQSEDQALQLGRCLGVEELQGGAVGQRFADGQDQPGEHLPLEVEHHVGVQLRLDPGREHERAGREEQAGADLADRGELHDVVDPLVDPAVEDEHQHDDHHRVHHRDLRREPLEAQEVQVHLLGLQHPARRALVVEAEEPRDEDEQHGDACQHHEGLAGEDLAAEGRPVRRGVVVVVPPQPEDEDGHEHQHRRDAERHARTEPLQHERADHRGEEPPGLDAHVEVADALVQQAGVLLAVQVADHGDHAGLDAARAERDQAQAQVQAEPRLVHRQDDAARGVDQGEAEHGLVFPDQQVRQEAAQQRAEVVGEREQVEHHRGLFLAHG